MSHKPGEQLTPKEAHEIARRTALPCPSCGQLLGFSAEIDETPENQETIELLHLLSIAMKRLMDRGALKFATVEDLAEVLAAIPTYYPVKDPYPK